MKGQFSIALALVFLFCCGTTVSAWEDISPEAAQQMILTNPDAYILEVRTVCEYKFVGHPFVPEGQIKNIPYWKFEFDRAAAEYIWIANVNDFFDAEVHRHFAPTDILIVVCKSGGRAGMAATEIESPGQPASQRLKDIGFTQVYCGNTWT